MNKTNSELDSIIHQQLADAKNFVIVGHIRPDGDAVGSMLGLAHTLRAMGKVLHASCRTECLRSMLSCLEQVMCGLLCLQDTIT